jgi:hypothetical protein
MSTVRPQHLAPLIPVAPNEQIFQYSIFVDGSFEGDSSYGAAKVNLDGLPHQIYKVYYKEDTKTAIGFNVFKEGADIKYQPFFWTGDVPPKGRLESDQEHFKAAGPVMVLDEQNLQEARAQIDRYPWLMSEVKPVLCSFDLDIVSCDVSTNPAMPAPQIVSSRTYTNTKDIPVTFSPLISYEKNQLVSASVTDRHSFEAGVNLHVEHSFGWIAGETTFAIDLSFTYGYTHETTSTAQDSVTYRFEEPCEFTLNKDESAQVQVIVEADWDATATIAVVFQLSGKMNGSALDSAYLRQLVLAQSPVEIVEEGSNFVQYKVQGQVQASVVHNAYVTVKPI